MKRTALFLVLFAAVVTALLVLRSWSAANEGVVLPGGVRLEMVKIPGKDYWMGKYEVTQAQWEAVMGGNPSEFKSADRPVDTVSWNDCQAFLKKLNALPSVRKSGLTFRLPTEDEWVHACRAGGLGPYCKLADGSEISRESLTRVAWFAANANSMTHPVGQKEPNAFGLYDMHGNLWEWTQTPTVPTKYTQGWYVLHGGCWDHSPSTCEFACHTDGPPDYRNYGDGFRLCASSTDQ